MMKSWRYVAVAAVFAGTAGAALAQPPGPGGFERNRKEADRKVEEQPGNPAQALERQLQELRARTAEVEAQLAKLRGGESGPREGRPGGEGGPREGRPMPPGGPMGPGRPGFAPGAGGPGPGGPMGPGGGFAFGRGGSGFPGGLGNLPVESMSAEQIKQLIGRLQQALEAKTREGDQPKKPGAEARKPGDQPKKPGADQPKKPEGDKGARSQEEILRRLDQINKELDEIRRSLKK